MVMDDAQLQAIWQRRQRPLRAAPLAQPLGNLMKHTLGKRARQLGKLSEVWDELIPPELRDHTALEGFYRGVLTVMVDSAAHRFNLQTLLTGGLLKEIRARCPEAINKIRLVPGQFYTVDAETGSRRYGFS
ncbi:MAG TPA: DUF721 domain-containing protein [Phycisphaerae bacterium]|nr:DUF721 domain-containing protein [Phycisphaerae bacterium]HDZ44511.1 DUF721 domain-containing protein [Phycisphaerae bacterium]